MNDRRIGIGSVAAVLLAALLSACASAPTANGAGAVPPAAEAYPHDAYFY